MRDKYISFFVAGCAYNMRFHYKFKPAIDTDELGKEVVEEMNALAAALPRFCGNKSSVFEGFGPASCHLHFEVSAAAAATGRWDLRPLGGH